MTRAGAGITDHWDSRAAYQARSLNLVRINQGSPIVRREFMSRRPCPWCVDVTTGRILIVDCLTCHGLRILGGRTV